MPLFVDRMRYMNLDRTVAGMNGLSVEDHIHKRLCDILPATLGVAAP